jgi:hypothetical protein
MQVRPSSNDDRVVVISVPQAHNQRGGGVGCQGAARRGRKRMVEMGGCECPVVSARGRWWGGCGRDRLSGSRLGWVRVWWVGG